MAATTPFLLSRTLDPSDYAALQPELATVTHEGLTMPQRWEQALALRATNRWRVAHGDGMGDDALNYHVVSPSWRCLPGMQVANVVSSGMLAHVDDPAAYLYHLSAVLAPGGLMVLTMPYWNRCGADTAHGHESRKRIYCPKLWGTLRQQAAALQLTLFGGVDPTYHGARIHDYTLASLVLEKRR